MASMPKDKDKNGGRFFSTPKRVWKVALPTSPPFLVSQISIFTYIIQNKEIINHSFYIL